MKVFTTLIPILIVCSTFLYAQLSGNLTIGPSGNYATFTEAIDSLKSQGVSGSVEFAIQSGSYQGHFTIPEIDGVSEINTITFKSQEGIADSVVLWDSTTVDTNYVIKLDGADYVIFKDITLEATGTEYGSVIFITGKSDNNRIIGNILNGNGIKNSGSLIYSENSDCDSLVISDNICNEGGACIRIIGDYNNRPENIQIINNTFNNMWAGIHLDACIAPKIIGNTVDVPWYVTTTTRTGIYLTACEGAMQIVNNRIHHYNSYGFQISSFTGTASAWGLIANNFVYSSTTTASNWGMVINNSHYLKIYHNTVVTRVGGYTFGLSSGGYGGSHIRILNNNFIHLGSHTAYSIMLSSAVETSDHNNFYTGGHYLANWYHNSYGSTLCPDLDSLQRCSGMDVHSLDVYPMFPDPSKPYTQHPWLDGAGTPVDEVTEDIDGNPRDPEHPDIGCCEFTSNPASIPYSGNLTIGNGGDFSGFSAAVDSLMLRGISAPVQLDVLPGTYNEQLKIRNIPGTSKQDTVVFQSQSGNPQDVTLHYTPPDDTSYVVQFYGADQITFKSMTLFGDTTAGSTNYYIFSAFGENKNLQIRNNILSGPPSTNTHRSLITMEESSGSGRIISGNTFNLNNYLGIVIKDGAQSDISILDNTFHNAYLAISIHNAEAPLIKGNQLFSGGMDLYGCNGPMKILENEIYLSNKNCLRIRASSGSADKRGLIANNFFRAGSGGGDNYGIQLEESGYQDIYYNSISITGTSTVNGRGIYVRGVGNHHLSIVNNILSNTGGGYSYYVMNSASVTLSDYNDLYTTGENLAHWDGFPVPDLDSLQTLSGFDLSSLSADPGFLSASDLHTSSANIDSMAAPVDLVLFDIDGEQRDPLFPDMGADEFEQVFNVAPEITSEPDTMAYSDSLYQYQITASDENGDTLQFHIQTGPSWLQINDSTGLVSGIPSQENAGDTVVTILVADGHGGTDNQTYPLHVIATTGTEQENLIVYTYALHQNYPNPFNPVTTIKYQLARAGQVDLSIYNILGQKIATLVSEKQSAGIYNVTWDASNYSSGMYFYRIQSDRYTAIKKLIVVK